MATSQEEYQAGIDRTRAAFNDQGTSAPTRTLEQTQSTDTYQAGIDRTRAAIAESEGTREETGGAAANIDAPATLTTEAGVGANDDNPQPSTEATQSAAIANGTSPAQGTGQTQMIKPQPNILDRFANYTYQASVYLVTQEQYDQYQKGSQKNFNGYYMLFQSGGAPNNVGGPKGSAGTGGAAQGQFNTLATGSGSTKDAGRSPFFADDFYIDAITIKQVLSGKGSNSAASSAELKFTVVEPANITLLDRMYQQVQDAAPKSASGDINYAAAMYMLVIRFYGYDLNGNLLRVGSANPVAGLSDGNAFVEKVIPFKIATIDFSVSNKTVVYEFNCLGQAMAIGGGTRRGTVPQDVELTGSTVGEMLGGTTATATSSSKAGTAPPEPPANNPGATTTSAAPAIDVATGRPVNQAVDAETGRPVASDSPPSSSPNQTTPAPAKADAAPTNKSNKSAKQGLLASLNELQQQYVKDGIYDIADVYKIEFAKGAESIRDAKVAKPGDKTAKGFTPMLAAPSQDPSQSAPSKGSMDTTSRNQGVTAGQQVIQMIETVIRNSSYVTDQALTVIDEATGKPLPNPKASTKAGMKWFNIMVQTRQLNYDKKRNDYAYEVTYVITPYTLTNFKSAYFPEGSWQGVHKKYNWWFTGENTSVLDYQATFNKLYNLTMSGSPTTKSGKQVSDAEVAGTREVPFLNYQARSTESAQGAGGKANELAASAAEYLYNTSDSANGKIKIIGDPAWIQQGSIAGLATSVTPQPFLADGTINFDIGQVLFEIAWQKPADYDLNTGLADPYAKTQKTFGDRSPIQSIVYQAVNVTSEFRAGRFEQTIEGTIYNVPKKKASETAAGNGMAVPMAAGSAATSANGASSDSERLSLSDANPISGRVGITTAEAYSNPAAAGNFDAFSESARAQGYGSTGVKFDPGATGFTPTLSSGEFGFAIPGPSQTISPASPAAPPTSNGGVTTADENDATAERLAQIGRDQAAQRNAAQQMSRDW